MRIATVATWIFVGVGLVVIGALLYVLPATEGNKLASIVAGIGGVYLFIGGVLTVVHDSHMAKRTRAGESERNLFSSS
jgi:hypothetical protein